MNDTEMRLLASDVSEMKKTLDEIKVCLMGNMTGNVGLIADHHNVKLKVEKCETDVRALKCSVLEIKLDKTRVVAWVAGAGVVGGFVVSVVLWLAEKLKII